MGNSTGIHDAIRYETMTECYIIAPWSSATLKCKKNSAVWKGVSREYSGRKWGLRWTLKDGRRICMIWEKGIYFSRETALAELLGIIKVQSSYENTIPVKGFNKISAPQQMTHLFKYPTIFKTTEFLDDVTVHSISCNWV